MREAVIVSTARTGIGRAYRGSLNNTKSPTVMAHAIVHAVQRAGIDSAEIHHDRSGLAIPNRPAPASLVFAFAEGLVLPSMIRTGLAFLNTDLDVKGPTFVGDTIYVRCEVVEARPTKNLERGLVRTRNAVENQDGKTVIVYQPLRLMKRRPSASPV